MSAARVGKTSSSCRTPQARPCWKSKFFCGVKQPLERKKVGDGVPLPEEDTPALTLKHAPGVRLRLATDDGMP